MSRQPEALSWAATVLALSIAGLAYLYTTRRDAKERKVQREGLLAVIEGELESLDPWCTGWRPEWVQHPPPQWLNPFYGVLPFPPHDAIAEGALRGTRLGFQNALVRGLARLKQIAQRADSLSALHRQLILGQAGLAIGIKRKQVVEPGEAGGVRAITFRRRLRPDEKILFDLHLGLHGQLVRDALDPLERALADVREGIVGERRRAKEIAFLWGKIRPVALVVGYLLIGTIGVVGSIYTFVSLWEISGTALSVAGSALTSAENFGRSLLNRRP